MKFFALLFFAVLLSFSWVWWKSDGFSPSSIQVPLLSLADPKQPSFSSEWPRKFKYLGKGNQAFAFESEDGKYVIKFFKAHKLTLPWYAAFASDRWIHRRKERIRVYPDSYRVAFERLREETGLLQVHMGVSEHRYPSICLIDRASRQFQIDLNEVPFVLQEKAGEPFFSYLSRVKDSPSKVRSLADQYLALQRKRIGRFVANRDSLIKDNYRWRGEKLLYVDPGHCFCEEALPIPGRLEAEWKKAIRDLQRWVRENAPGELTYLETAAQSEFLKTQSALSDALFSHP